MIPESKFRSTFPDPCPIIGMIHLPPLLGYDDHPGMAAVLAKAERDLHVLAEGGVQGVLVENEFDQPHSVRARPETIAAMTLATAHVVEIARAKYPHLRVGVEILLQDPVASLSVAAACGAHFIRTDYFVDRMWRHVYGGEMPTDPEVVIAYRTALRASNILIFADVQVKYAIPLDPEPSLARSAHLAVKHHADGIIVTGETTGDPVNVDYLQAVRSKTPDHCPILIGSGLRADNAAQLLPHCDGAIVGTGLKRPRRFEDGTEFPAYKDPSASLDPHLVRELVEVRKRVVHS